MPFFAGAAGRVYYRHWRSVKPQAQVIFLHGYGEHSGLYHRLGDFMAAKDIDLWALDAVGHGLTYGERGNPDTMAQLRANAARLVRIAQTAQSAIPIVLIGHSMGAMTAASLLIQDARPFRGAILTGIPLEELTPEQERQVSQGIMSLDPFYLDELENDPLKFDVANAFVHLANLFSPAVRAEVQAGLPKLQLPILLVCGDRDLICSPDLVRRWAPRIPMARERVFAETHHDLFNDASQGEVSGFIANAIIRWAEDSVDSWRKLQDVPDGRSDASGAFASTAFASSMPH